MENLVFCAVRGTLPLSVRIAGLDTITLQVGNIFEIASFEVTRQESVRTFLKNHHSLQYAVLCVPVSF